MKKLILVLFLFSFIYSLAHAKDYDLTVDEANLVIQCINLTPVPNVEAAMAPLNLRNIILTQAQEIVKKNPDVSAVKIALKDEETELLVECMKKSKPANVANAEQTIVLIKKIIAQYNNQQTKPAPKKKIKKKNKKTKKKKK